MNNKEFVNKLARKTGTSIVQTMNNLNALVAVMTDRLKENDQLNVSGFGIFEVKMRKERISVNPKTGQRMLLPPKLVPFFRPSSKIKDKLKQGE